MTIDLTAAAIEKLETLAVAASGQRSVSLTTERGRVRVFHSGTGEVRFVPIPELPPVIVVRGLDDLTAAIADYGDGEEVACFIDESGVTAYFDLSRNGHAQLMLTINPAIGVLTRMKDLPPAQLRRLLRVDLFDVTPAPLDFCEVISVLKFEATQTNEVALRKGDESIGKSVRSKVTAEQDIPDTVAFTLSVYPDLNSVNTTVQVRCAVVTDPSAGTLSVMPYPGEIDRAITFAVNSIQKALRSCVTGLHVYCGKVIS